MEIEVPLPQKSQAAKKKRKLKMMMRSLFSTRRFLSTKVAKEAVAQGGKNDPPKKLHGIIGRYAMALYTSASKVKETDKVESELLSIKDIIVKQPNFSAFLKNPTISRGDKVNKLSALLDEKKFSHITRNLFMTLAANGKISEANKVISAYEDLMETSRGVVQATITSSEELNKKTLTSIEAAVKNIAGAGKTVNVSVVVDPSILGGLQVQVGDKFLDLSVQRRINDLTKALEGSE